MRGKHHIIIETENLKFEFEIKRNITVVQGDSATGKTTLVDLIAEMKHGRNNRGIRFFSDVPCEVYAGDEDRWRYELEGMAGSIVFIDEDYRFIYSREFAEYLGTADNYFVLITRKPLRNLPYSINEIYGIRTSGKYHFPDQIYHEFYPIYMDNYDTERIRGDERKTQLMILVEDSRAGYQFFEQVCSIHSVVSAGGNTGIYSRLTAYSDERSILVIADGAAFGSYIENVVRYAERKGQIGLYFPESFEWMVLKSGVIRNESIKEVLSHPEDFIDSEKYLSWERFFTSILREKTSEIPYLRYNKEHLPDFYTSPQASGLIMKVMPEEIRDILLGVSSRI